MICVPPALYFSALQVLLPAAMDGPLTESKWLLLASSDAQVPPAPHATWATIAPLDQPLMPQQPGQLQPWQPLASDADSGLSGGSCFAAPARAACAPPAKQPRMVRAASAGCMDGLLQAQQLLCADPAPERLGFASAASLPAAPAVQQACGGSVPPYSCSTSSVVSGAFTQATAPCVLRASSMPAPRGPMAADWNVSCVAAHLASAAHCAWALLAASSSLPHTASFCSAAVCCSPKDGVLPSSTYTSADSPAAARPLPPPLL